MTDETIKDGGYYAIKGFAYQFDKAILEILTSGDENASINLEHIQDIDTENFVMQVKYKEAAKFVPSAIRAPIIQLINEFKKNSEKIYILYAHFGDLNGYEDFVDEKRISLDNLDSVLGDQEEKFTTGEKQNFIDNFYLDFSPEFQVQFQEIISKLKEVDFVGKTDDEAIFFYANISDFLINLVINNPIERTEDRKCTRREIFDYLKRGRKLVFNSAFREYQGDQNYFKFIKRKYFTWRNIDYFERFIIIELPGTESVSTIKDIVFAIKNKFYNKSGGIFREVIKSGAPYVYLKNITEENLKQLKSELSNERIVFKDGYDFLDADFSLQSIKTDSTINNNLCLKLVSTEENLISLMQENFSKPKEIYQFYINEYLKIEVDIKNIEIQIKNISDINFII